MYIGNPGYKVAAMINCTEENGTNKNLFEGLRDSLCTIIYQADLS